MYNPFTLRNKNIIVTGASSGIGRQCALDCSKMGAKLIIIARDKERLKSTFMDLEGEGHLMIPFDLTSFNEINNFITDIVNKMGPISGVIHSAGISSTELLKRTDAEQLDKFFHINVYSSILLTKEICKIGNYDKNGCSVLFISSIASIVGGAGKSTYAMTKGALNSGVRSLASEYARKKIRFNTIAPGVIETPININQPYLSDPELRKKTESQHLLGIGRCTDISYASIYLLSDASRWVTGQTFIIDGGFSIL